MRWWRKPKPPPPTPPVRFVGGPVPRFTSVPSTLLNVGGDIVPDEFRTEPITAFRWWHVVHAGDGTGLALKSLHVAYLWNRDNTAECVQGMSNRTPHDGYAPHPACACGLYAEHPDHPLKEWQRMAHSRVTGFGPIALSGRIIDCDMGFKAQHATITGPIKLQALCAIDCENTPDRVAIPDGYKVVVSSYCPDHAPDKETWVQVEADVWLRNAARQLSVRYGVEVVPWIGD